MKRVRLFFVTLTFALSSRAAPPAADSLLATAFDSRNGVVERTRAFLELRAVAGEAAIPALAKLLADPAWAYPARSVLEVMPEPAAERALLEALRSDLPSPQKAGVIQSLGDRRAAEAVSAIAPFLTSSDAVLVHAALDALGNIATIPAADALAALAPPAALNAAWTDALLRVGAALESIDRRKSFELYRRAGRSNAPHEKGAAIIGLARVAEQPVADVLEALQSAERASRQAALAVIRSGKLGPELIAAVGRIFTSLPSDLQVQVLAVLYDRGDRTAAAIARPALTADEPAVRTAAANLLAIVGESADAPSLAEMMIGPDATARAARRALARIPGGETTALLLTHFRVGGAAREAALEVLIHRGYRPLLAELLRPEIYTDAAFDRVAFNAILTLARGSDLGRVLALYLQLPAARRHGMDAAVRRVAAKHSAPDDAAALVMGAAKKLPAVEAGPLFLTLAGIGGDAAFAFLSHQLESPAGETRMAALRALGSWRDRRPGATLLKVAEHDSDPKVRATAVQAVTAVLRRNAVVDENAAARAVAPGVIDGLRQAWKLAEQSGDKDAVVAALRGLKDPQATLAADELEKARAK